MHAPLMTVWAAPLRAGLAAARRVGVCVLIAAAVASFVGRPSASAQELPDGIRKCAAEADDARRLECYDREVGRGTTPETGQPARPAATATPTLSPEERFGLTEEQKRRKQNLEKPHELERLTATVTGIARRPHGELVVTLDNGQIWAEKRATSFLIQEGETVTIKAAALGSFLMVSSSGRSTRVARVH